MNSATTKLTAYLTPLFYLIFNNHSMFRLMIHTFLDIMILVSLLISR